MVEPKRLPQRAPGSVERLLSIEEIAVAFAATDVTGQDCRSFVRRWNDSLPEFDLDALSIDRSGRRYPRRRRRKASARKRSS